MHKKTVKLLGKKFDIEGVGPDDPYFLGLSNRIDRDFKEIIQLFLTPDSVALDIGANIGITSLLLSQQLCDGSIFSFEPAPDVFSVLSRNLLSNAVANVAARQVAVGAKKGVMGFAGESAYGHLVIGEDQETTGDGNKVAVETLDEIVESLALERLDFVKIDVEGFEADVLSGGKDTEARFRPLYYIEFNSFCISAFREMNPLEFARQVFTDFEYVFHVSKRGELTRMDDAISLLHRNIVKDGSVSNLLLTNSSERLKVKGRGTRTSPLPDVLKKLLRSATKCRAIAFGNLRLRWVNTW